MSSSQQPSRNWSARPRNARGRGRPFQTPLRSYAPLRNRINDDVERITAVLDSLNLGFPGPGSSPSRTVSQNEIDEYAQQMVDEARPSETELSAKRQIRDHLQSIVRRIVSNGTLKIIGGVGNSFALKGADIDMCIDGSTNMNLSSSQLENLAMAFRRAGIPQI